MFHTIQRKIMRFSKREFRQTRDFLCNLASFQIEVGDLFLEFSKTRNLIFSSIMVALRSISPQHGGQIYKAYRNKQKSALKLFILLKLLTRRKYVIVGRLHNVRRDRERVKEKIMNMKVEMFKKHYRYL